MQNKIIVITGTTASGKTELSLSLAEKFNGEIVSADSMQVYKQLNIGTAKATKEEMARVKHHMVDMVEPDKTFTLADYLDGARSAVKDILSRGKLPIIVGGTGLYVSFFVKNITLCEAKTDLEYRSYLNTLDGLTLKKMLEECDPERAAQLHENDKKRLSRALELYKLTSLTTRQQKENSLKNKSPYEFCSFCLTCESREELYRRINMRVDKMFDDGLEKEVASLYEKGLLNGTTAAQAIGYKEFLPYFSNEQTLDEVRAAIKQESRRYAKRQLTWFRHEDFLEWLYIDKNDIKSCENSLDFLSKRIEIFINICYNNK